MMAQRIELSEADQQAYEVMKEKQLSQPVLCDTEEATPSAESVDREEESKLVAPNGWKLALIMVALCLGVFCMALVSSPPECASREGQS